MTTAVVIGVTIGGVVALVLSFWMGYLVGRRSVLRRGLSHKVPAGDRNRPTRTNTAQYHIISFIKSDATALTAQVT